MKKEFIFLILVLVIGVFYVSTSPVQFSPELRTYECVENVPGQEWVDPFREYLKENENDQRKGRGPDGLWRVIDSPEGGNGEICYGHKLQDGEPPIVLSDGQELNPPLTDAQCDLLLEDDITRHIDRTLNSECVRRDKINYQVDCLS